MAIKPSNKKDEQPSKRKDISLWLLVILLVAGGVGANYYYQEVVGALRLTGWILLTAIITAIVFQTAQGRALWNFTTASRGEMRKVVWPTRQQATQTTMLVMGLVIVASLILWGIDSLLLWAVGLMSGGN